MGQGEAMNLVRELASRGLFLERDLSRRGISRNWLGFANFMGVATPRGFGVWSHPRYEPTRYECVQLRFPRAVFWGPSALWLLGVKTPEPDNLWVAIANKARTPRRLDLTTVVIRTRNLEKDVTTLRPENTFLHLRVHARERAERDLALVGSPALLARAAERAEFKLPPRARFLSSKLLEPWYRLGGEEWVVASTLTRAKP